MQASISIVLDNKRHRRSSIILTVKLKYDSEETVEIGTDIISLAIIESIGYVSCGHATREVNQSYPHVK